VEPGATDPFHCTALGRAIVAHLPDARRDQLLAASAGPLEQRTQATVTDRRTLVRILAQVSTAGHAVERDQTDVGVTCVGAPVFRRDEAVAAVSLSVPTARAGDARLRGFVRAVRAAAAAVTDALTVPQGIARAS
jgi:DNA-binding IclR family transcriptional regulator